MSEISTIYNEIIADLKAKGFNGLVKQLDHDYKNVGDKPPRTGIPKHDIPTSIPENEKTKNDGAATLILLSGGPSSLYVRCD